MLPILLGKLEARSFAKCKTGIVTIIQCCGVTIILGSVVLVRCGKLGSFLVKEATELSANRDQKDYCHVSLCSDILQEM